MAAEDTILVLQTIGRFQYLQHTKEERATVSTIEILSMKATADKTFDTMASFQ